MSSWKDICVWIRAVVKEITNEERDEEVHGKNASTYVIRLVDTRYSSELGNQYEKAPGENCFKVYNLRYSSERIDGIESSSRNPCHPKTNVFLPTIILRNENNEGGYRLHQGENTDWNHPEKYDSSTTWNA